MQVYLHNSAGILYVSLNTLVNGCLEQNMFFFSNFAYHEIHNTDINRCLESCSTLWINLKKRKVRFLHLFFYFYSQAVQYYLVHKQEHDLSRRTLFFKVNHCQFLKQTLYFVINSQKKKKMVKMCFPSSCFKFFEEFHYGCQLQF